MKLEEMVLPEQKVLEKLNAVSTAKRLANMVSIQSFLASFGSGLSSGHTGTPRLRLRQTGRDPQNEAYEETTRRRGLNPKTLQGIGALTYFGPVHIPFPLFTDIRAQSAHICTLPRRPIGVRCAIQADFLNGAAHNILNRSG